MPVTFSCTVKCCSGLQSAAQDGVAAVRKATSPGALAEIVQGSGLLLRSRLGSAADGAKFGSLHRLAGAATAPLLALGRGSGAAVLAVGSTVARLVLGLVRGAVQVTVFAAALFYLLAAEEDPLAAAAGLLPLSGAAQARVIGVLAGTIKRVPLKLLV